MKMNIPIKLCAFCLVSFLSVKIFDCQARDIVICPTPLSLTISRDSVELPHVIGIYPGSSSLGKLSETYVDLIKRGDRPSDSKNPVFEHIVSDVILPEMRTVSRMSDAFVFLDCDRRLLDEEYVMEVSSDGVSIRGGSAKGVWWGLQSFTQVMLQVVGNSDGHALNIPFMTIVDKPFFPYRGALLDCTRHFFPVEDVKEFIDIMALHKLNVFHWHLTDDQGWRIEIKKYPLLAEKGSIRQETLVGRHRESHEYDGTPYGGYYTQEEIREVVEYAADRQIMIVPEIEMPGHAVAALACYPWLGCTGGPYEVRTTWGISDDVFCLGKETTFEFLKNVLDEVCELFPGEYIHIGGDETPSVRWQSCPDCQKIISERHYKEARQLQSYLLERVEPYLNSRGKKIIGWDEILEGGVTSTACIMSWRGPAGGIAAAKQGNFVIMSPNNYMYYDYAQTYEPEKNGEPLGIGGHVSLRQSYSFDPYDNLSDEETKFIKGIQANLWTEYIKDFNHLQFMALPRFNALSEIAWAHPEQHCYDSFLSAVRISMIPVYQYLGYIYAPYAFEGIE